jgi:glycoside/pentoside/hexuronide:cation symporter, GPH family
LRNIQRKSLPFERHVIGRQSIRTLLAYGGLALPLCLAEIPIVLYLPAFYAQEMRLSAGVVGAVFLLARMWDGLWDMLIGWLSDRTTSRFGRRKPWAMIGAPLLMASTWFLCNPPVHSGLIYLCCWAAVFYTSFTAVKIPHLSWGTEMATDYVERSRVTTFREAFTMLGNLFFVSAPLIFLSGEPRLRDVLFLISVTTLLTVPPSALALGVFVRDPLPVQISHTPFLQQLKALSRDRILLRYLVARLLAEVVNGVTDAMLVFSFGVGLQLSEKQLLWSIFILYIANLSSLPFTLRLARSVEKHHLLAGGLTLQALALGATVFIPAGNFAAVAILWVLIGAGSAAMLSLPTSILSDIIDNGEVKSGQRHSGAYVAVDNLVYKIGLALGVGLSFGLLAIVNYDPGATQHSAADAHVVRLIGFGLPCLLSVPSILLYLTHPISRRRQQQSREIINARAVVASPLGGLSNMAAETSRN